MEQQYVHIISNRSQVVLWKWAEGPQDTPQPFAPSFCKQWSADRSRPGERWQSFGQWERSAPPPNLCPVCATRAEGHQRTLRMIHAGAERARMEANGQYR